MRIADKIDWDSRFRTISRGHVASGFGSDAAASYGLDAKSVASGGATLIDWTIRIASIAVAWILGTKLLAALPSVMQEARGHERRRGDEDEDDSSLRSRAPRWKT
jgi:hypothetical protein